MTRKEFEEILRYEKKIYIKSTTSGFLLWLYHDERYFFYRYLRMLRYEEYYLKKSSLFARVMAALYRRKRNAIGNMVDIKIVPFFAGKGVNIHHKGVIINGHVGEDCIFHGRNTIGNNTVGGGTATAVPLIGNRVDIGIGAVVIGEVSIADDVKIGANAVVVKSVEEKNSIIAGVPAKKLIR